MLLTQVEKQRGLLPLSAALHIIVCWNRITNTVYGTYRFLAERRSEDTLAALVEFGHDDILCLVGARLRREVEDVRLVYFLVQLIQQEVLQRTD